MRILDKLFEKINLVIQNFFQISLKRILKFRILIFNEKHCVILLHIRKLYTNNLLEKSPNSFVTTKMLSIKEIMSNIFEIIWKQFLKLIYVSFFVFVKG